MLLLLLLQIYKSYLLICKVISHILFDLANYIPVHLSQEEEEEEEEEGRKKEKMYRGGGKKDDDDDDDSKGKYMNKKDE